jgi:hypothetical protein
MVALTAIPTTGQTFAGWTGACSGTGTCAVTMNTVKTVGAIFNTPVTATTTPAPTPTTTQVNMATPTTYTAQPGGQVTITLNWDRVPMASNYLQFMHLDNGTNYVSVDDHNVSSATWSGSSPDPRIITLPGTLPVGVYDIKVGLSGGNPWKDLSLAMGTGVTNPGNTNAYKVGVLTVATSIPAPVSQNSLTVSLSGTGSGTVTSSPTGINCGVTCGATFATGTLVTLTATPTSGQTFAGWTGACSGTGNCTVTMSIARTVGAIFNAPVVATSTKFTLNQRVAVSSGPLNVRATANGTLLGTQVTTALGTVTGGPVYTNALWWWNVNFDSGVDGWAAEDYMTATSTQAPVVQNSLTVSLSGTGSGTVTSSPTGINCGVTCGATFATGTLVTLTATPTSGQTFAGWTGACSGTGNCTVTMSIARTVGAIFNAPVVATSTKFTLNQRVAVSSGPLNVRATANGTLLGTQVTTALGTVTGGPVYTNALWWWNVNFDSGVDGWAAEDYMTATSTQATSTAGIPSGVGPRGGMLTVSGPITVSQGQTVSGLKISNPNGPCITVIGSNVRITDNEIGPCGTTTKADMDVGVLVNQGYANVTIDHNYIHDSRAGIYAYNASSSLIIEKNYFRNVFGGIPRGQYVQFNGVRGSGHKIRCNIGEQDPINQGAAKEDSFSIYNSSGTVASPIEVAYNKLRGGSSPTGCGIMTGEENSAYISVHHNNVVHPGVCGIAIAGGKNISLTSNKVYSNEGVGPGMYVWEWSESGKVCKDHTVANNLTNWPANGGNDFWNAGNCTNVAITGNTFGANIGEEIWNEEFAECSTISP